MFSKLLRRFRKVALHSIHSKDLTDENAQTWLVSKSRSLLLLGFSLTGLFLLLTKVPPAKVADVGLAQSYLPLLALVFILVFSLCRLLLSFRYALYIGIASILLVFIQVHQVILAASYALIPILFVGLSELLIVLAKKR